MDKIKIIDKRVFLIIIFILVFFLFVCFLKNKIGVFGCYIILSESMLPSIEVNDAVIIKKVDDNDYSVGDVITFYSVNSNYNGAPITHRIIEKSRVNKNKSLYVTKGDNNYANDGNKIETDDIYGKVIFVIPKLGYIYFFFSKNKYLIFLLLIILLLFIYVFKFKRKDTNKLVND